MSYRASAEVLSSRSPLTWKVFHGLATALIAVVLVVSGNATAQANTALKITEIMYNPAAAGVEFIELQNTSAAAIDVSGVHFSDGIMFVFPASTTLAPGAFYVIAGSATDFAIQYPDATLNGVFSGLLAGEGEPMAERRGS